MMVQVPMNYSGHYSEATSEVSGTYGTKDSMRGTFKLHIEPPITPKSKTNNTNIQ
jgi:hypothetical protein